MPESKKQYFVQVGRHPEPSEEEMYGNMGSEYMAPTSEWDPVANILWDRTGRLTESFYEAEAHAIIAAKTYKNVRIAESEISVVSYVGGE
jgi:hypothetical protein